MGDHDKARPERHRRLGRQKRRRPGKQRQEQAQSIADQEA